MDGPLVIVDLRSAGRGDGALAQQNLEEIDDLKADLEDGFARLATNS